MKNLLKKHFENNLYKINDEILLTNWINKIIPLKKYHNKEKLKKGRKHQRHERYDMKGIITKIKYQVYYVKIIDIFNSRDDIKIVEVIRVTYGCIIKITWFYFF